MKDYKKILEGVVNIINTTEKSDIGFANICAYIGDNCPELKESEDERVKKRILLSLEKDLMATKNSGCDIQDLEQCIAWLEKQDKVDTVSYEVAENEKREFVGDGFIKCYADFQDFKEGETYWLEYVGKDNYNVRSDNLLGQTFHITPKQLYTVFRPTTWLEKQNEQKPQRMISAEAKEAMYDKPSDKIEPKFNVGDWVVYYRNDSSREVLQVYDIRDSRYYFTDNVHFSWSVKECDEKSHLWTIQDAKDGDVLASKDKEDILIHKSNSEIELLLTSYISFSKKEGFCPRQYSAWDSNEFIPATKEQRDLLFQKMHEFGYEWDAEKKELKLLITNGGDFGSVHQKGTII